MNTVTFTEQEALDLMVAGSVVTLTLVGIGLVLYFISAIGYWRMFKKAGSSGWKAFIPFVNTYEMFRISWNVKKFWIWFCTSTVSVLLLYFSEMIAGGTALHFLPDVLGIAASVVALDFIIKMNRLLARAYGKGRVFGACLFVFPFFASLVLGFGGAKYLGNQFEG